MGDASVTPYNMYGEGRDLSFMTAYYPKIAYTPRDGALAAVSTYAPLAAAAARGDRGGLFSEAFKALAPRSPRDWVDRSAAKTWLASRLPSGRPGTMPEVR